MFPELRDRPVFICGHPKSGTSLLRALLDGHPQLVVYPEESVFFRRFLPRAKDAGLEEQLLLAEEYLIHIFTWNQTAPPASQAGFPDRDYSAISFEAVRDEMRDLLSIHPPRHTGDILSAAVFSFGKVTSQMSESTKIWVEKSPYNEHYSARIFDWWPQARCIHLVRDPRDNHLSYRRKHPDWRPEFFARNWVRSTQAGLDNRARFGEDSYLILRYEDLVQSPEDVLRSVCSYMDIDFEAELTTPVRAGESWRGNSMFDQDFAAISTSPVGRWRQQLDPSDADVIEAMAAPQMRILDYQCPEKFSPQALLRAYTWPLRRLFNASTKGTHH
ncbi:MAG: sulfotransferase [Anaerolineae bacterium]|nr:sulfotransferase [Anaerolineae bacterium]